MMRPVVFGLFAALLLFPMTMMSALVAQDGTSGVDLSAYPGVDITVTDTSFEVSSDQIPAGYILLSVTNNGHRLNGAGLLAIPEGQTADELMRSAGTSEVGNTLPPFVSSVVVVGGLDGIPSGETQQQVVHVTPGEWLVFGPNLQQPVQVTVAETDDSVTEAPTSDVVITESNSAFSGFDQMPVGEHLVEVTNQGDQSYKVVLFQVPDGTTLQQAMNVLGVADATPAPGGLQNSDIARVPNGQVLLQSPETSVWIPMNLAPGTFVAVGYTVDQDTGRPQPVEGMVSLFEVGGSDTPETTPAS